MNIPAQHCNLVIFNYADWRFAPFRHVRLARVAIRTAFIAYRILDEKFLQKSLPLAARFNGVSH